MAKIIIEGNVLIYKIMDIEDNLTKKDLKEFKKTMGGDFTLKTNCGVDVHSSEMENGVWNGITIKRLKMSYGS